MSSQRRFQITKTWCGEALTAPEYVEISVQFVSNDLQIAIDAPFHGDPSPPDEAGSTNGLWDFEVVELFLVGEDGQYLELEFGPHGHYLMLWLTSPRVIEPRPLACSYRVVSRGERWHGRAVIPAEALPRRIERVNAFAISGLGEARKYLAWQPLPGSKPDFHQPKRFGKW